MTSPRILRVIIAQCAYEIGSERIVLQSLNNPVNRITLTIGSIDPLQSVQTNAESSTRLRVTDPQGNYQFPCAVRHDEFASDVIASVAVIGENQKCGPTTLEGSDDSVVEISAAPDVTRRNPTGYATALKLTDYRRRNF